VLSKHHEEVNASVVRKSGKTKGSLRLILQFEPTPGSQPQAAVPSANNAELVRARRLYGSCSRGLYRVSTRMPGQPARPLVGRHQLPQGGPTFKLTYPAAYSAPRPVLQLKSLKGDL
jgi:hypothetical protein